MDAASSPATAEERREKAAEAHSKRNLSSSMCPWSDIHKRGQRRKEQHRENSTDKDERRVEHCEDRMNTESLCTLTENSLARFASERAESS